MNQSYTRRCSGIGVSFMLTRWQIASLLVLMAIPAESDEALSPAARQWWADISFIASDANEGRQTGSAGYMRAADYVIGRMKAEGLAPAGDNGFLQQVTFEQQVVDQDASRAALVDADGTQ